MTVYSLTVICGGLVVAACVVGLVGMLIYQFFGKDRADR